MFMRISWGKLKPAQWPNYEQAFKRVMATAPPPLGCRRRSSMSTTWDPRPAPPAAESAAGLYNLDQHPLDPFPAGEGTAAGAGSATGFRGLTDRGWSPGSDPTRSKRAAKMV